MAWKPDLAKLDKVHGNNFTADVLEVGEAVEKGEAAKITIGKHRCGNLYIKVTVTEVEGTDGTYHWCVIGIKSRKK